MADLLAECHAMLGERQVEDLDAEADGRERYLDLTPDQRITAMPDIIRACHDALRVERRFAMGWLAEHERTRRTP